MSKHVFISYSKENREFANLLNDKLKEAGFETWIDRQRLKPGKKWRSEIDRGIRDSFALVVIMTQAAKASEYVTYEWSFALGLDIGDGEGVIPVLLERVELHPRLEELQYLDFTDHIQRWDELVERLKEIQTYHTATTIPVVFPSGSVDIPTYIQSEFARLDSYNEEIRETAYENLIKTNHPKIVDGFIERIDHPIPEVRIIALEGLYELSDKVNVTNELKEEIVKVFRYGGMKVREKAIKVIAKYKIEIAIPYLISLLEKTNDANIASIIVSALGELQSKAVIENLLVLLKTVNLDDKYNENAQIVRSATIIALGKIGDSSILPELLSYWENIQTDQYLQIDLIYALGLLKDSRAVPILITALSKKEVVYFSRRGEALSLSKIAQDALESIGTPEALETLENWRNKVNLTNKNPSLPR